jgi:ribosomal protein S18 acetylase RimI-like enzyme
MTEERFQIYDGLRDEYIDAIGVLLSEFVLSSDVAFSGSEAGEEYFRRKYDPDRVHDWKEDVVITVWDGDDLAGFGRARKNGFITHIFVAPEYRQQGLGTRILQILEESLGAEGLHFIFLDADMHAVEFYERQGWNRREPGSPMGDGILLIPMEKRMY